MKLFVFVCLCMLLLKLLLVLLLLLFPLMIVENNTLWSGTYNSGLRSEFRANRLRLPLSVCKSLLPTK